MRLLSRFVLLAVFALPAMPVAEATELTPHRAEYRVKISILSGRLNTELRATEDGYVATHVVKPTGMSRLLASGQMRVSSAFTPVADGMRPVTYHAIDTIGDDPEARIQFDWSTNTATGTVGGDDVTFELDGLSHDAVSIQYELMHDLLTEQPNSSYTLFDVDKMRVANIKDAGKRSVRTRAGVYDVVGIQHQRQGSSRVTTMWCAPQLDYLPVIIEQHKSGKLKFRATLTSYTPT
ncbi:MAG: DUF3108 domain-containing protein [Woeseiaceae bacterium]|nr:DUF3108 domain-containing protein [Woeseiaceae bacterium]